MTLKLYEKYIIKTITIALIPIFTECGIIFTRVLEGERSFIVAKCPLYIMRYSMKYYGRDYNGAKIAAKLALGDINIVPVKLSGTLGLYWFKNKSSENADCVWFALHHYQNAKAISPNESNVYLSYGHKVRIPSNVTRFKRIVHNTHKYKDLMIDREQANLDKKLYFGFKTNNDFRFISEHNPNTYDYLQKKKRNKRRRKKRNKKGDRGL